MREAEIKRKTKETEIIVRVNLDEKKFSNINIPEGFFLHMLETLARHVNFGIEIKGKGDIQIDWHHLGEDTGIVLGKAINKALSDKAGINRFGWAIVPMDEALALVSIDISGRPYLAYNVELKSQKIGEFDTEVVKEFFAGFVYGANITLHINLLTGDNSHHSIEAIFKGFAKALSQAISKTGEKEIPSTKEVL